MCVCVICLYCQSPSVQRSNCTTTPASPCGQLGRDITASSVSTCFRYTTASSVSTWVRYHTLSACVQERSANLRLCPILHGKSPLKSPILQCKSPRVRYCSANPQLCPILQYKSPLVSATTSHLSLHTLSSTSERVNVRRRTGRLTRLQRLPDQQATHTHLFFRSLPPLLSVVH